MKPSSVLRVALLVVLAGSADQSAFGQIPSQALRARDVGVQVGVMRTGPLNAITDVAGVAVGHTTIIRGDSVRTGVTAVVPHGGNVFEQKVPAAIAVFNGFGKLAGSTQVEELGTIETPIVLTNTLSVGACVEGVVRYVLAQNPGADVRSVNAVVGETNDGYLNDIRGLHVRPEDAVEAIASASSGVVREGNVGAGTGTTAFGYKGGIGTASRMTPPIDGMQYTVGVLVQSNFGRELNIIGVPFTREMRQLNVEMPKGKKDDGSCMIVVATDAPLSARDLKRLAMRAFIGMGRTTSVMSSGSGDYAIAFSTAYRIPHSAEKRTVEVPPLFDNDAMTVLFRGVEEATEEAIYNSLFAAESVTGFQGRRAEKIPLDRVVELIRKYNMYKMGDRLRWRPYEY
jgi:D-aminopeptidase